MPEFAASTTTWAVGYVTREFTHEHQLLDKGYLVSFDSEYMNAMTDATEHDTRRVVVAFAGFHRRVDRDHDLVVAPPGLAVSAHIAEPQQGPLCRLRVLLILCAVDDRTHGAANILSHLQRHALGVECRADSALFVSTIPECDVLWGLRHHRQPQLPPALLHEQVAHEVFFVQAAA